MAASLASCMPKNPNPSEAETQKAILQYLSLRHLCWRNNTGAFGSQSQGRSYFVRYGKVGSGDILGVRKGTGQFFSIEVKARGRKPTPEQLAFMDKVNQSGGLAFVAYSVQDVLDKNL